MLSEFLAPDGSKSPALCLFENTLGGRVLTYPARGDFGDGFFTHSRVAAWKDILALLDPALPRIDCHAYTLAVVKTPTPDERYYFIANLSADKLEEVTVNGTTLSCDLPLYGAAVFAEKNGSITPVV